MPPIGDSAVDSFQGFLKDVPGAGEVEAHKGVAFFAKHIALFKVDVGFVNEEVVQFLALPIEAGAVEPGKVGAFRPDYFYFGDMVFEVIDHQVAVVGKIDQDLPEPVFAVFVGSLERNLAQEVETMGYTTVLELVFVLGMQVRIGNDDVGGFESGEVEGFAAGGADDGVLGKFRAKGCIVGEGGAVEHQVAVDFVGNNEDIVLIANFAQTAQFSGRPDTADWIMGAAKDKHFVVGIGRFLGQVVEVHGEAAVFIDEGVADKEPVVVLNRTVKRKVDRGLDNNPIARFGEGFN